MDDEYPRGDYLFHYTTREVAFEQILPEGQLRFSPYVEMRDPLENKLPPTAASYDVTRFTDDVAMKQRSDMMFEFSDVFEQIWNSARLLALTTDAPDRYEGDAASFGRGWARARMWDQYAEQHHGACFVFSRERLIRAIERSLHAQGLPSPFNHAVTYTEQGPAGAVPKFDLERFVEGGITFEGVAEFVEAHHDPLFFLKTLDWAGEYEYRFVVTAQKKYVRVEYDDALEAVVVGERFPSWQRTGAIEACDRRGAKPYWLRWQSLRPLPEPME